MIAALRVAGSFLSASAISSRMMRRSSSSPVFVSSIGPNYTDRRRGMDGGGLPMYTYTILGLGGCTMGNGFSRPTRTTLLLFLLALSASGAWGDDPCTGSDTWSNGSLDDTPPTTGDQ